VGHPGGGRNERLDTLDWGEIEKIELPFVNHLLPEDLPPFARNEALSTLPFLVLGQYGDCDYPTALAKEPRMAHLMRFAEFDAWLAGQRDITIEVEIKAPKMVRKALDIIEKSETPERYILFSGVPEYIDEIQSLCAGGKPKGLRLGANIRFLTDKAKKRVEGMDLFEVGLNDKGFTDEDCAWLKDRGVSVFSNLGDYPEWWSEMCAMDVLGFKTNYPGAFTRWWNGEKP